MYYEATRQKDCLLWGSVMLFALIPDLNEVVAGIKDDSFVFFDLVVLAKNFRVSTAKLRKMILAVCIYFCSNFGKSKEPAIVQVLQNPSEGILEQYLRLIQKDTKEIMDALHILDNVLRENSSPDDVLKVLMSNFRYQHQKIFKVCSRLLQQPVLNLEKKTVEYLPSEEFSQTKKRIREDNIELLTAFTLGLINPKYLELFCPGINASYFIDYSSIQTDEDNFLYNLYIKNKVKENLIVLSSIFMKGNQTSLRMKNKYGTIHYNLKSKHFSLLIFPNMLNSPSPFSQLLLDALESK